MVLKTQIKKKINKINKLKKPNKQRANYNKTKLTCLYKMHIHELTTNNRSTPSQ